MIKWLIRIIWGDTCQHDWELLKANEFTDCTRMLFNIEKRNVKKNKKNLFWHFTDSQKEYKKIRMIANTAL